MNNLNHLSLFASATKISVAAATCTLIMAGCASTENAALKSAEKTYADVSQNATVAANAKAAEHLQAAQITLAKAQHNDTLVKLFDAGDAKDTDNLAYVAEQEALTAKAIAASSAADQELAMLQKDRQVALLAKEERDAAAKAKRDAELAQQQELAATLERAKQRGAEVAETPEAITVTFRNLTFATNKADIQPEFQTTLDDLAQTLSTRYPNAKLTIKGHTDSTGPEEYNQQLSKQRAIAVQTFLIGKGLPAARIASQGLGETQPVAANNTPDGRAQNRRVELVITGHQTP